MGFDKNRFRGSVKHELICFLCEDVLSSPVQTRPCEHYFCNGCLAHWLQNNDTCPIDHRPLTAGDLDKAPKVLTNLLSELELSCDFASLGCPEYVKLGALAAHVKECLSNPDLVLNCFNECGAILRRQSVDKPFPPHCWVTYILSTIRGEHVSEQTKRVIDALLRMQQTITGQEKEIKMLDCRVALKERQATVRPISKTLPPVAAASERAKAADKKQAVAPSTPKAGAEEQSQDSRGVGEEQNNVVNILKHEGLIRSPQVIEAMAAVDLKDFYDENPYGMNRATEIGLHLEELLLHTKDAEAQVLLALRGSVYVPVCLALMMVGGKGSVVLSTNNAARLSTVYKNYGSLIVSGQLIVVYESYDQIWGKGNQALAPYDLIVGNSTCDFKALNGQLKPGGRIVCSAEIRG